ncbi:putative holin-like toxin [Listeria booriae]|uniref:Putative holin-like toxin n=1 Tax=Listeria booriae TaxID=1552123 RepID=A0A7X0XHA9_9LIST|nr:putative holin-like toxin [Listeria booriae]MBC1210139.1 putative holin-like toxin [Listeria booriae]MBC1225796.1 putative holin-like toxin [Listeria booriae]MBC1229395.1 putative holin-like toxin [Listeria booriae]MBC1232471.1 putative holin-like toxin [Listeria booriae]MBC1246542.1 putative holin-like toxin [Listeria booriae]
MSVAEALTVALGFGMFVVSLVKLVIVIVDTSRHDK